jgi:predicted ATPase
VVGERLAGRQQLLVLDNFEQVLDAATVVAELLRTCPSTAMLVTSRAPLEIGGEQAWPVQPLALPASAEERTPERIAQYPAIALFVERATAARPNFAVTSENVAAVAEICHRLDGLPLAIELAAARIRLLSPEAMLPRLGNGLGLLAGGRRDLPARQQTLRSAIAWSYELLSDSEQRLFCSLSVFVGSFTLDAAEAVAADDQQAIEVLDVVGQLVSQSLVRADLEDRPEPRFGMLETIREFGLEMLAAAGETARRRDCHLRWCADLAERAARGISSSEQALWLDRVEEEHENLRGALAWADQTGDIDGLGLQVAIRLGGNF